MKAHIQKGPDPLSEGERLHFTTWISKMVRRAEVSDIEGMFRMSGVLYELIYYYFRLKDRWYLGSKIGFKILREENPKLF